MPVDTCLSMAGKTAASEDREILQTVSTDCKNGSSDVKKWASEIRQTDGTSGCSPDSEDWHNGFPLLRMALLGLPMPQPYGTAIQSKPAPPTTSSSEEKACKRNSKKSLSSIEDLKPIVFVSVDEEAQFREDCESTPNLDDETAEADSLSDTIYPALLCSPDLESPTSQDSSHISLRSGDADGEENWLFGVSEVGTGLSGSNSDEDSVNSSRHVERYQIMLTERNRRKRDLQLLHSAYCQVFEDKVNKYKSYVIDETRSSNCHSCAEVCDCSGVLFLPHNVQGNKHTCIKQFTCIKCGRAFKQLKNLKKHGETLCTKKFHYDDHYDVSTGTKLKCDMCDRKFSSDQHLKNHILTHTGKRPYTCDLCECSFIYKSHVARHRLTHTNERHYVCDYCSYSFIQKSNFLLHQRTMACKPTPTAKRVCDVCCQTFSKQMYLDSHLKKHTALFISTE